MRSKRLRAAETGADHPLVTAALECAGRSDAKGSNTLSDMALLAGVPAIKCGPATAPHITQVIGLPPPAELGVPTRDTPVI